MTGIIFDIKELGVHDGPGLRTTVFLKGCPLRCIWCHNPEGLRPMPQLSIRQNACTHCGACSKPCKHPDCQPYGRCLHVCPQGLISVAGEEISAEKLVRRLKRNQNFWGKNGGVTFSGGEPLMQADFVNEVVDLLGEIPTAIETSGYAAPDTFRSVISGMQLVYMDLKLADDDLHRKYTGVSNAPILENLKQLRESGIPCVIRTPLIPGITDTNENLNAIKQLAEGLPQELLPYNQMAAAKYSLFDMEYPYEQYAARHYADRQKGLLYEKNLFDVPEKTGNHCT